MDMLGLPLVDAALSWAHANNTLVVSYAKPRQVLEEVRRGLGRLGRMCARNLAVCVECRYISLIL